jgi:eukaryotic-like serine/threonine-protein kinase
MIGKYDVVRLLKAGGMASATLCRDPDGRLVVLKIPLSDDKPSWSRLRDEGRVGRRVSHHGLVETIESFEYDGKPVLVVGYVHGAAVHDIRKQGPLSAAAVARIGWQIASSLHTLHEACDELGHRFNVIHRDVSGGNILVDEAGDARLIDLGIAKFDAERSSNTGVGMLLGTLRYMAPEVLTNSRYSPASDLWALGITLVEAATGKPCFTGNGNELVVRICDYRSPDELPLNDLDPELKEILKGMLQADWSDRLTALPLVRRFSELERAKGDAREELSTRVKPLLPDITPKLESSLPKPRPIDVVDPEGPTISDANGPRAIAAAPKKRFPFSAVVVATIAALLLLVVALSLMK